MCEATCTFRFDVSGFDKVVEFRLPGAVVVVKQEVV